MKLMGNALVYPCCSCVINSSLEHVPNVMQYSLDTRKWTTVPLPELSRDGHVRGFDSIITFLAGLMNQTMAI